MARNAVTASGCRRVEPEDPDIESAVDELIAKGVVFEQYDTPKTDAKGIHRNPRVKPVAWFRDPAGNIIGLNQD